MSDITHIGVTNFRNDKTPFGIKDEDRLHHIYVIGKTGTGKSTLLLNMAISGIQRSTQNLLTHIFHFAFNQHSYYLFI
ncbi:MAG: ATP-binding protein [Segetibacter sp.]|nr:ATP-binding protein [Segetibacter sp.]